MLLALILNFNFTDFAFLGPSSAQIGLDQILVLSNIPIIKVLFVVVLDPSSEVLVGVYGS